ncbi:hypothetical protein ACOSQ4_008373 [Xanthoceras sorbifolium]
MAITTSCCLNLSSPTTTHAQKRQEVEEAVCGLQIADFEDGGAIAKGMMIDMPLLTVVPKSEENSVQVPRWSDKRMCPPWQLNSLETIVPENLPRPSARRRLESIHYSSKTAPVVINSINITNMAREEDEKKLEELETRVRVQETQMPTIQSTWYYIPQVLGPLVPLHCLPPS